MENKIIEKVRCCIVIAIYKICCFIVNERRLGDVEFKQEEMQIISTADNA